MKSDSNAFHTLSTEKSRSLHCVSVTRQISSADLCYAPAFICEEPVQAQAHGKAVLLGDFSGKKGVRYLIYKAVFIRF